MNPNNELRDKDLAILQAIHDGASTVTEIREATTLTTREINYSLNEYSLQKLGLVKINRRKGRQQTQNGKTIWKPKTISLTDKGLQKLTQHQPGDAEKYKDMSRRELIEEVHELEEQLDRLENVFKDFRSKVMEQI